MPARDQRDSLLVVHPHPAERLTDVARGGHRVGHRGRPLRVDVDQPHLGGRQGVVQIPDATVSFVGEPRGLRTPVGLVGLPHVCPATGEPERREAHRLQRAIAREDHQVGPGDLEAILLLHRPQQPARLVQVAVVRKAVQGGEALHPRAGAAPAVTDAVGAGAVPGHPQHERSVMAEVGGPPVLRGGQHLVHIACQLVEIQGQEFLGVVEVLVQRIGRTAGPSQGLQVEPAGPIELVPACRGVIAPLERPAHAHGLVVGPVDVSVRALGHWPSFRAL